MTADHRSPQLTLSLRDETPKMPSIDDLMLPLLHMTADEREHNNQEAFQHLATVFSLTNEQLQTHIPSGRATVFETRVQWAASYLRGANLLKATRQGHFRITEAGLNLLANPPTRLKKSFIDRLARNEGPHQARTQKPARSKAAPSRRQRQHDTIPGSRVSLFRDILAEAGTPLHYEVIYEHALKRLPTEQHFAKNLAYVTLYASPMFRLIGDGVFELASAEPEVIDIHQTVLAYAPQPLLPRDADARTFFESIMIGREWLKTTPRITARDFYRRMCAHLQLAPGSTAEAQTAFDAWYAAGLLDRLDYTRQENATLSLAIDPDALLADVRRQCLSNLCARISGLSHLLMALQLLPRATIPVLQTGLYPDQTRASDLATRLTLLAAFDAVRRDGDAWKLTPIGQAVLEAQPPSDFHWHEPEQVDTPTSDANAAEVEDYLLFTDFDAPAVAPAPVPEPPPRLWPDVQEHMRASLFETIRILFPLNPKATDLIKRHSWGNETYVGQNNGKPVSWKGWSANLWYVDDQYGTIYIDHVENVLRADYQLELFGKSFVEATASYPAYLVAHVDGLSPKVQELIHNAGFVVRVMGKTVHACIVVSVDNFLAKSEQHWAAQCARLLNFHRSILGGR